MSGQATDHQEMLKAFSADQRVKAELIALRRDEISLHEQIEIVERVIADYQALHESLELTRI